MLSIHTAWGRLLDPRPLGAVGAGVAVSLVHWRHVGRVLMTYNEKREPERLAALHIVEAKDAHGSDVSDPRVLVDVGATRSASSVEVVSTNDQWV